jgi:aspartate aminotransferase
MQHLAERIAGLEESATLLMAALVRELKAQGADIIDLTLGEPDFDTPVHIKEAAKRAIDEGYTKYTPVPGYLDLRKAIAAKLKRDNQLDYTSDQIVVSTGAKQSIANVVLSLINPGDEVLLPAPYWVSYSAITYLAEGVSKEIPTNIESGFKISPEQLEAAITEKTRLFIFSSPCNPSGAIYSKAELEALAVVFKKYPNVMILSDEIYEYINYGVGHTSMAQIEGMYDRTIVVNGFSKAFAMTGWRLGYIAAPLWVAKACVKMQGQFTSGTCSISQKAGETAMESSMEPTWLMRDAFKKRRDLIYPLLKEIPGVNVLLPDGAFYFFPDISAYFGKSHAEGKIANAHELSMYLLKTAGVSTVSGESFGNPNCIRFSYATSEEKLKEGLRRIKAALAQLH